MKNTNTSVKGRRSKRSTVFTVITAVGIVLLLALNMLLTYLGQKNTVFIDMTNEGFYTLTDRMKEECELVDKELERPVEITFCADPDTLMDDQVTRLIYVMAQKMSNKYKNINLKTVNVTNDPTSVAMYKTTSLTKISPTDVIISYGNKHRIASAQSFWTSASNALWSFNGEYKMMSIILSLTSIKNQPVAYFITGHGETCYDVNNPESESSIKTQSIYELLTERGLAVKILDLSAVSAVPDDCALLVLNNPTSDFTSDADSFNSNGYVSDLEKIDRYLTKGNGSLMVAKDHEKKLTNLEDFLIEWGFLFSDTKVKDETSCLPAAPGESFAPIIGVYDTDENSYGNALYGDYAASATAPQMIFTNTGYITCSYGLGESILEPGADNVNRHYAPFIGTSENAYAYKNNGGSYDRASEKSEFTLAAVTSRHFTNQYDANIIYSYVFCANSADFLSNELIGNSSYANFDMVSAVVNNMVRTDLHASSDLGGTSLNSTSFGGKQIIDATLYEEDSVIYPPDLSNKDEYKYNSGFGTVEKTVISVLVYIIPAAILAVGIAICVKRRFL